MVAISDSVHHHVKNQFCIEADKCPVYVGDFSSRSRQDIHLKESVPCEICMSIEKDSIMPWKINALQVDKCILTQC